jgi:hypothetical protein
MAQKGNVGDDTTVFPDTEKGDRAGFLSSKGKD